MAILMCPLDQKKNQKTNQQKAQTEIGDHSSSNSTETKS